MTGLKKEIKAYEAMLDYLERKHFGQWVIFRNEQLVAAHADFQDAAQDAVSRFGRGPYLIRQVGAPPIVLPPYVIPPDLAYKLHPDYDDDD